MRILVVEDDFISRKLLCRYLDSLGVCDVAINGHEAIAAVSSAIQSGEEYDLICLDIMMPGKGGQETLEEIRSLEKAHSVGRDQGAKVIITSALEDADTMRKAYSAAADGYLVKPIVKRKFLDALKEAGLQAPVHD